MTLSHVPISPALSPLPGHLVGLVALSQAEVAGEVAGEEVDLLDVGDEGLVNSLLVGGANAGDLLLLFFRMSANCPWVSRHWGVNRTSGFSPCLKKASSPAFSLTFSEVKYLGCETSSIFLESRPETSTFMEVAMT